MLDEQIGRRHWLLQLGVVGAFSLGAIPAMADEPLVVVVARESPLTVVGKQDLERLYRGEIQSINGRRVLPLNQLPRTSLRERFDQRLLRMNADEVARYWIDRRIRGESGAPKSVPARLMAGVVAKLSNSVGYINVSGVSPALRVLKIDGKLPGEPGYALG